jgi:hypothetical protein
MYKNISQGVLCSVVGICQGEKRTHRQQLCKGGWYRSMHLQESFVKFDCTFNFEHVKY